MNINIPVEGAFLNLSPTAFRVWAGHFYKCRKDFVPPDAAVSPVPYFLLCKAIELRLKAVHLETRRQKEVKDDYGHHLRDSYDDLPSNQKVLSAAELDTLTKANALYVSKAFEYIQPPDPMTGFTRWPDLGALDAVAAKIMGTQ